MAWKAANILEGAYRQKANLINFSIADRQKILFWLKMNVTIRPKGDAESTYIALPEADAHIFYMSYPNHYLK